jgi:hypothetical protein
MWLLTITFTKEWHNQTTLHPLGLLLALVLGAAMFFVPRKYSLWPVLIMACFVAPAQRIVILTLDWNLLRLLVLFGWLRVIARSEWTGLAWNRLDTLVVAFCVFRTIAAMILYGQFSVLVTHLGLSFDMMGMYFLFRLLVRDLDDFQTLARGLAYLSVPVALAFLIEHSTGRNLFSIFGGVPEHTAEREGRLRCQGAFAHPILAGTFWASVLPLIGAIFWTGGRRVLAVVGVGCSLFIIFACSSATPLIGVAAAIMGWTFFAMRRWMRLVRWSVLLGLIGLHAVMNAPVWHLITRVDIIGGSTGYHRYSLINGAINHANEWWLIGSARGTAHWGHHLFDVTNQYIVAGLQGGIGLLVLLILILATAFLGVGRMVAAAGEDRRRLVLAWGLGVSLFVHATCFMAVTYFGQIIVLWHLVLALIGSLAPMQRPARAAVVRRRARSEPPLVRAPVSRVAGGMGRP